MWLLKCLTDKKSKCQSRDLNYRTYNVPHKMQPGDRCCLYQLSAKATSLLIYTYTILVGTLYFERNKYINFNCFNLDSTHTDKVTLYTSTKEIVLLCKICMVFALKTNKIHSKHFFTYEKC